MEKLRLQKFLAQAGVASRRKAEELITSGRVMVNGKIVTELGAKADPDTDRVQVDGKEIHVFRSLVYIIMHKPRGYITSTADDKERPVVTDLLHGVKEPVVPAGRLDWDTSGLLILTNDGDLQYALTHPAFHVTKAYMVRVDAPLTREDMERLEKGVMIDGRKTLPAKVKKIRTPVSEELWYEITITEGRNRQIRKMFETIGRDVKKLKRVRMGEILLGGIEPGHYRSAEQWEIDYFVKIKKKALSIRGNKR
ncbi:pseudouridine synthase [Chrysiogenes arsenatis]|uniref:pseudouridine synthase n=1 Tax=Chrysiogenes arsenatis TaxID=309797 RepID=UPI00040ACB57|nr:pseudouridine synthase [Chrysiogenes arsenatis]